VDWFITIYQEVHYQVEYAGGEWKARPLGKTRPSNFSREHFLYFHEGLSAEQKEAVLAAQRAAAAAEMVS